MSSMATSSSPSSLRPSTISPHHPSQFTPIEEGNEDDDQFSQGHSSFSTPIDDGGGNKKHHHHTPTPFHHKEKSRKKPENGEIVAGENDNRGVKCNKCRPSNREKISVVPVDSNGLFRSIFSSIVKKSPRSEESLTPATAVSGEEQWKIAATELSYKLIQANKKRDEAILEASRLKYSMSELEKKLNKLEIYCHSLKSGLEVCSNKVNNSNNSPPKVNFQFTKIGNNSGKVIEKFLISVSESRSSIRILSRSLAVQLRQNGGGKVYDKLSLILQPYDIKVSISRNPRSLLCYLEALLNKSLYEDFESIGFQKGSQTSILNPIDRCESNFAAFNRLKGLTWDAVLTKGTKHFSEDFSKFCDRKMSEIVAMLGWNGAWPEGLLQSFFTASKSVWIVHLLANSIHPSLPIFRVDKDSRFDPIYMEDMGGDKAKKLVPSIVRIMVIPGFYVYDNVVKCKVICRYYNNNSSSNNECNGKVLASFPS